MGRDGAPGVGRGAAELPLRGDRHDTAAPDALVHLLAAATAPARRGELAGEEAAVAALRQSRQAPVHAPGRRKLFAGLLTVKITAAFALTTVSGVALAAAGGFTELPGTSGFGARPAVPTDAPSPSPAVTSPAADSPAEVPRTPAATPAHPPVENLCRVFIADPRNKQAGGEPRGLDGAALAALFAAAGGKAGVWAYCSRLLGAAGAGTAPDMPRPNPSAGQLWDQYRNRTHDPSGWRSYHPQPQYPDKTGQNGETGQNDQHDSETPDRDPPSPSPRPGSRSAPASSLG